MSLSLIPPDKPLGEYRQILLARSTDPEIRSRKAGTGGAVTGIAVFLLETGLVDGVVAAKRVKGLKAELVVARTRKEVVEAAGTKWSVLPYTAKLREALYSEQLGRVMLIGLPCQAQFLYQMKMFPLLEVDFVSKIYLVVSLFCIGTFASETFVDLIHLRYGLDPERVNYITLEKNAIKVVYDGEEKLIPLEEVLPYMQTGCLVCPDYTGIFSDISAGISELYPGYTVLIVRTERGEEVVERAVEKGYLEVRRAGADVVDELETKARGKMLRAAKYMSTLL